MNVASSLHLRRWVLGLASVLAAGLVLSVAAALSVDVAAAASRTQLTFWSWRTEDQAAYDKFIAEFRKQHPDIDVKFIPYKNTEYNTILATALQGGSGPDIVHLRAYGGMEPLANAGYLVPLDGVIPELSNFPPEILAGARNRRDGRIYGVPFALQTVQVLYNKRIFRELGLSEPQTWEEFKQVAAKLKAAGYVPFANGAKDGWTMETFFGAIAPNFYGGTPFFNDVMTGKTTFEDPRFIAALNRMLELKPYLPDGFLGVGYTDMQILFAQEIAGMFLAGSYELGTMKNLNPNIEIGMFVTPPLRKGDPVWHTMYVDGSYGVNAASPNREAALTFVRWLATRQYGQMFTEELAQISAVPGTQPVNPTLAEMAQSIAEHGTPYLMLTGFRFGQPSGSTLLQNTLQGLFAGQLTPEQVAAEIQAGLARWHEPFMKK